MPFVKQHISQLERTDLVDSDVHSLNHHDNETQSSDEMAPSHGMPVDKSQALAPSIPARNTMRASRTLQGIQLHDLKAIADFDTHSVDSIYGDDPHEMYLSSEEDGSEAADESVDGSDASYVELDEEFTAKPIRSSFEETAKAIAFVFSGRAQVIDVFSMQSEVITPKAQRAPSIRPSLFRSNTSKSAKSSKNASRRPSSSSIQSSTVSTIFTDSGSAADPMPSVTASRSYLSLASVTRSRIKSQASSRRQTISPLSQESISSVVPRTSGTPVPEQQMPEAMKPTKGRWGLGTRKRPSMPLLTAALNNSRDLLDDSEITVRSPATDMIEENKIYNSLPTTTTTTVKPTKPSHKKNRLSLNLSSLNLIAALEKTDYTSTRPRESGIQSAVERTSSYERLDAKGCDDIVTRTVTVSGLDTQQVNSPIRSQTTGDLNQLLNGVHRPAESQRQSGRSGFKFFGSWGRSSARV